MHHKKSTEHSASDIHKIEITAPQIKRYYSQMNFLDDLRTRFDNDADRLAYLRTYLAQHGSLNKLEHGARHLYGVDIIDGLFGGGHYYKTHYGDELVAAIFTALQGSTLLRHYHNDYGPIPEENFEQCPIAKLIYTRDSLFYTSFYHRCDIAKTNQFFKRILDAYLGLSEDKKRDLAEHLPLIHFDAMNLNILKKLHNVVTKGFNQKHELERKHQVFESIESSFHSFAKTVAGITVGNSFFKFKTLKEQILAAKTVNEFLDHLVSAAKLNAYGPERLMCHLLFGSSTHLQRTLQDAKQTGKIQAPIAKKKHAKTVALMKKNN